MKAKQTAKEKELKAIIDMDSHLDELGKRYHAMMDEFVSKHSPWQEGDKVIVQPIGRHKEYGKVHKVDMEVRNKKVVFRLIVWPWTINWEREKERRYALHIFNMSEIITHIPNDETVRK